MRFQIRFKDFPGIVSPGNHPLLGRKSISVTAVLADSSRMDLPVSATNTFEINDPDTRFITVRFTSSLDLSGPIFKTLKIIQSFGVQTSGGAPPSVSLTPYQWFFEFLQDDQHS